MREFGLENGIQLTSRQRDALVGLHKTRRDKKIADRLKAVLLLADGFPPIEIERILLMSERHVRRCRDTYLGHGYGPLLQTHFQGSEGKLDEDQLADLEKHLQENLYQTANEIREYVRRRFKVRYSTQGIVPLLHRLGFVYKKAKGIPGKCDRSAQQRFVKRYRAIRRKMGKNDRVFFGDATHPTINTQLACGWIKKGEEKHVATTSGRHRMNLHGAYDPIRHESVCLVETSINSESTMRLLDQLSAVRHKKGRLYLIVDGASYYIAKAVLAYARKLGITIVRLPTYSPNLNLIERLWKFYRRVVLANRYYGSVDAFRRATIDFFKNLKRNYSAQLATLMTEKFHFFDQPIPANSA